MTPQQESFTVPRRPMDVEDYLDILRRHKAWILGPTYLGLVISVVVAFLWPDTFVSTAVLRVVPPSVPEAFVPNTVNVEMSQRINSMAQQILSRGTLTNIVNTYNLYPRMRNRMPMEDIVEDMRRKDIKVSNVVSVTQTQGRQVPAFQISFQYENRQQAQKVASDLVSKFMSENARERSNQAVFTSQFLGDEWEKAKKELDQIESKLADFRMKHSGQLPEQYQANLQQMNALESRASSLNSTVSRINQEKLLLESQLRIEKDKLNALSNTSEPAAAPAAAARNERLLQLEGQIQQQELRIAALRDTYRDTHPDMQREIAALAQLKKQRDAAAKEEPKKPEPQPTQSARYVSPQTVREIRDTEGRIRQLQSQVEAKDLEAEQSTQEIQRVNGQIRTLQSRIEVTPIGEKEYQELVRDRESTRLKYEELNRKKNLANMGQQLENRQQGESLEVLDPASLPQTPTEPKRPVLIGIGTGLGFLLGLFLAGGREMKDTSLKNLKDVRAYTQLTVLGSIPLLENDLVVRRRKRLGWLAWSTACIIGAVIMSGSMYYYYFVNKT